jgi:hypothetical protein
MEKWPYPHILKPQNPMISISSQLIEEIAEQLDCGMKCYLNISSGEMIAVISDEDLIDPGIDTANNEIKENPSEYLEFHKMNSHESFNVMMDFAMEISDKEFQTQLIKSLKASSPFRNFKLKLDSSDNYRQKWFDYRKNRYIDHVKSQIAIELSQ